jgi:MoxR-like ATPase
LVFIRKKEHFPAYFQGGIIKIVEDDFKSLTGIRSDTILPDNEMNEKPIILTLDDLSKETYFPTNVLEEIQALLEEKKQIIFYGPPGTSKTFLAKKFAAYFTKRIDNIRLIQFHQSYSYEDFIASVANLIRKNLRMTHDQFRFYERSS